MPLKSVWSWKDFVTEQTFVGFARIVLHYEVFFHRVFIGKCFLTFRTLNICSFWSMLAVCSFAMLDQHFGSFAHFTASGTLVHVLNARVLGPTAAGGEYFVADQAFISSVVNVRCIVVMFTFVGVQGTRQKKPFFRISHTDRVSPQCGFWCVASRNPSVRKLLSTQHTCVASQLSK